MTKRSITGPLGVALLAALASSPATAAVFVNELHYDNSNGDANEGIEVVATAGEDLSTYKVVLYNGASPSAGVTYSTRNLPAGSAVNGMAAWPWRISCGGAWVSSRVQA